MMDYLACPECNGDGTVVLKYPGTDDQGCDLGHYRAPCPRCEGEGKLVPIGQLQGAVEALEKIEARADPKRSLDGQAAAVALDSIYRWAQKGLNRPGGR